MKISQNHFRRNVDKVQILRSTATLNCYKAIVVQISRCSDRGQECVFVGRNPFIIDAIASPLYETSFQSADRCFAQACNKTGSM